LKNSFSTLPSMIWDLVAVIEDGGQSAKNLNRPGIQRALQMMRDGNAQGFLVTKLDRMTRNLVDLNILLSDYFTEKARYQASLFSVGEQVDTRTAGGRMMLNMLMTVSQWEREVIGERTKAALSYKKSQGVKLGRPEKHITDPEEIKTVNYAAELRRQKLTLRAIAAKLDAEGYKISRGGKWASQTVQDLLKMEAV